MSNSTPIIFFGTESYSGIVLQQLIAAGQPIAAVVTKPDFKSGRGQQLSAPQVKQIAEKSGIAVWQPNSLDEIRDSITESKCDWAVLVAYGKILPGSILDLFKGGIINVHPSLLPRWRGPSPVESSILNGDAKTGVSIMKLTAEMDAGPVYLQSEVILNGTESKQALYDQLFTIGAKLLADNLEGIFSGQVVAGEKDDSQATYSKLIKKEDGRLDFINKSAEELEREIRAFSGWPKSYTTLGDIDVAITTAHISTSNGTPGEINIGDNFELSVYCKSGSLYIDRIQPSGKQEMSVQAFLSGYKEQLS